MGSGGFVFQEDGVDGPGACAVGDAGGDFDEVAQAAVVDLGDLFAAGEFFVEDVEFGEEDGGLHGVEAAVHAGAEDLVAGFAFAVGAEAAKEVGAVGVVGEERAAVAVCAEGLAGEEAGGGGHGLGTELLAVEGCAEALGEVVDGEQAVLGGDGVEGGPVGGLAEEIDADEGSGLEAAGGLGFGDAGFEVVGVDLEGSGIDVDEDGGCAEDKGDFGGGGVGECREEDGVAGADAFGHHGDLQGVGAGADADAVFCAAVVGEAGFELGDFGAHDELAVGEDGVDAGFQGAGDAGLLRLEV